MRQNDEFGLSSLPASLSIVRQLTVRSRHYLQYRKHLAAAGGRKDLLFKGMLAQVWFVQYVQQSHDELLIIFMQILSAHILQDLK